MMFLLFQSLLSLKRQNYEIKMVKNKKIRFFFRGYDAFFRCQ